MKITLIISVDYVNFLIKAVINRIVSDINILYRIFVIKVINSYI